MLNRHCKNTPNPIPIAEKKLLIKPLWNALLTI
jgi:hypothetical protein